MTSATPAEAVTGKTMPEHQPLTQREIVSNMADAYAHLLDTNALLRSERDALLAALTRLEAHVRILPPEYDGEGSPLAQARAALTASKDTGERS
jgi:hypothetical protein